VEKYGESAFCEAQRGKRRYFKGFLPFSMGNTLDITAGPGCFPQTDPKNGKQPVEVDPTPKGSTSFANTPILTNLH